MNVEGNNKEQEKQINLADFITDLNNLFNFLYKNLLEEVTMNIKTIEEFKQKYSQEFDTKKIKEKIENFEKNLIRTIIEKYILFGNNKEAFFTNILDILDLLVKFYIKDEFYYNTKLNEFYLGENNKNKLELIFLNIGKKAVKRELDITISEDLQNKPLNEFLDILILNIFEYVDIKIIFLTNNILTFYRNKNAFLSFKLITLNLIIINRLKNPHKFFNTILSNIIKILQPEGQSYSKRMNDELYNNAFSDFEYNVESPVRKLNNEEFNFLINMFFLGIITVIETLCINKLDLTKVNLTEMVNRKLLFEMIDDAIEDKKGYLDDHNSDIFCTYLIICFISDVFEFIFSNLHYLDSSFNETELIEMNVNPFLVYNEKMVPKYYEDFLKTVEVILKRAIPDMCLGIKLFLSINEIKSKNSEKIAKIENMNDYLYYIFEPFNNIGFSLITWVQWKVNKIYFYPCVYSDLALLDTMIPIIAALIKRGQNFKYMGIEMFLDIINQVNKGVVSNLRQLKSYNYVELLKDIFEFVGGPDHKIKRQYVNKQIVSFIKVLTPSAIKETFRILIDDQLKESQAINDGQVAYTIHCLKTVLNDYINANNLNKELFESNYLKEVIEKTLTDKYFVIDILETINYSLNLLHYLLVKDKSVFKGSLGFYNKDYLHAVSKNIIKLAGLVEKWIISPDEDKKQFVNLETMPEAASNFTAKRQEFESNLQARKVQAELTLGMINNVEKLVDSYVKQI
jgi:hypothetical protein